MKQKNRLASGIPRLNESHKQNRKLSKPSYETIEQPAQVPISPDPDPNPKQPAQVSIVTDPVLNPKQPAQVSIVTDPVLNQKPKLNPVRKHLKNGVSILSKPKPKFGSKVKL